MNSYINFFTIDEEDAFEIVGILTLTKKREGLVGGNLQNEGEIKKSEFGDEQKLFCIFDRYFRSILSKDKSLHVIYAGKCLNNLNVNCSEIGIFEITVIQGHITCMDQSWKK